MHHTDVLSTYCSLLFLISFEKLCRRFSFEPKSCLDEKQVLMSHQQASLQLQNTFDIILLILLSYTADVAMEK